MDAHLFLPVAWNATAANPPAKLWCVSVESWLAASAKTPISWSRAATPVQNSRRLRRLASQFWTNARSNNLSKRESIRTKCRRRNLRKRKRKGRRSRRPKRRKRQRNLRLCNPNCFELTRLTLRHETAALFAQPERRATRQSRYIKRACNRACRLVQFA